MLGALLDDNSVPLAFLQSSVGFFDGGPITVRNFPVTNGSSQQPGLFGVEHKAIPEKPHGALYTWRNYDRVVAPDDPGHRSADGTSFTNADKEVTDSANPTLTVPAGDALLAGRIPAGLHPVVADGYQHLDVLTAAPVQNNGRLEIVSTNLAQFAAEPK